MRVEHVTIAKRQLKEKKQQKRMKLVDSIVNTVKHAMNAYNCMHCTILILKNYRIKLKQKKYLAGVFSNQLNSRQNFFAASFRWF